MFLEAISNVGYTDAAKVKREVEQLNKNPFFHQFFVDISAHLNRQNVASAQQLLEYNDLLKNKRVLELKALSESMRFEEHQQKINFQKHRKLQMELKAAKKRFALLDQQLNTLDRASSDVLEDDDNFQEIAKTSKSALDQSRGWHKSAVANCSDAIRKFNRDCEASYTCYKFRDILIRNMGLIMSVDEGLFNKTSLDCIRTSPKLAFEAWPTGTNENDMQSLISLVDLNKYLARENDYKSELTLYARKLFENVQSATEDWNSELHSAADTILLGGGEREVKEELLGDLKRATSGYKGRKEKMVLALAKMEKSIAIEKFLLSKQRSLRYSNPIQDGRTTAKTKLVLSCLESLKYAIETTTDQSSYLLKSVLPNLLAGGAPKVKNLVLTGDFKQKLTKQREIRTKQQTMIDLLSQQCSRLTLMWMLLLLERTRTEILSKKLDEICSLLTKDVESFSSLLQILNSVPQLNYSNKERKAVIDKRDFTMLNLYNLLVTEGSSSSMFKTFESVREAATKLVNEKHYFRRTANVNIPLANALRELHWNHTDPRDDSGKVLLANPAVLDGVAKLQASVLEAKTSVPKLLTIIDKKRAYMEHNEEARKTRDLWMEFVALAIASK